MFASFAGGFHHFQHKNKPVITVYETQANLADHKKIQGLDRTFNSLGH